MGSDRLRPWLESHKYEKDTYYMLYIDVEHISNPIDYHQELLERLSGSFTNIEWVFYECVKFFQPILDECGTDHYSIETFNCRWVDLREKFHARTGYYIGREDDLLGKYIRSMHIDWLNITFYGNEELIRDAEDANSDFDMISEVFYDGLLGAWRLVKDHYLMPSEDSDIIYKLLQKVCNVYLALMILVEYRDDSDDNPEEWFLALPDRIKIMLTKNAEFPAPLETLEWYSLREEDYLYWYYMVRCLNYPGTIPGEKEDNDS